MSDPAFSVLIAAYNAERTLPAAIDSVRAQTRPEFEVVVVDDGSDDRTRSIATAYESSEPRLRVIAHDRNLGLASARNTGIAHTRAPYVALLDADDLWLPSYLQDMARTLDGDPGAGFAYTEGWALDETTRRIRRRSAMARQHPPDPPPEAAEEFLRELVRRNFVFGSVTMRRSVLDAVGGFDASLRSAEDYELWLRMLAHGYRALRSPGRGVVWRDRAGSLSKDPINMRRALIATMRLVADEHPAPDDVRAVARRRMTKAERELAVLEGEARMSLTRRVRRPLGRIRRRLLGNRGYYAEPPAEVARAFGDLRDV